MRILLSLIIPALAYSVAFASEPSGELSRSAVEPKPIFCTEKDSVACEKYSPSSAKNGLQSPAFTVVAPNIYLVNDKRVRLWGIKPPKQDDPLYNVAMLYLKGLMADTVIMCKHSTYEPNGTDVMQCFSDNFDLASMIIQMGVGSDKIDETNGFYETEESDARRHKRGIWKNQQ